MTVPTRIRTEAEATLLQTFERLKDGLPGDALARKAAIDLFAAKGMPHRRIESWHYTDLRAAMTAAAPVREPAAGVAPPLPRDGLTEGVRLVVLDGAFRADLSDLDRFPLGVSVRPLAEALANDDGFSPDPLLDGDDPVFALNTALTRDGVVIEIAPGAQVPEPLVIVTAMSGGESQACFARAIMRVGENASVTLVEDSSSLNGGATQSNEALILTLGAGSKVAHVARVAPRSAKAIHLHSLLTIQAERSEFQSFSFVADGGLVRRQIFSKLIGENATLGLSGLSLLDGERHADVTLVVDHAVPHGVSREFYRTILDGQSTGVYQGKVVVRPGAQKTDGGMKSNALVLSEGAAMYNKPELEIFADDVVCGHGATVAQLDEDQVFYLSARGLPRAEAEALLVEAFGAEAIERVGDDRLRDALAEDLRVWLARRRAEARS